MVIGGQIVRSLAMYTASSNFTHIIAERKKDQHALVTFGVYSYVIISSHALRTSFTLHALTCYHVVVL
jgi:hypothetical protein